MPLSYETQKANKRKKNHFKFGLSDWVFNGLISRDSITLKHLNQKIRIDQLTSREHELLSR